MHFNASTVRGIPMSHTTFAPNRRREDAVQLELADGFCLCGGLASTGELVELMRPHWRQPGSVLTRWMLGRKVVSFPMRGLALLPLFQFERPRFVPYTGVADAALALADLVSDEALAAWFLEPNRWLEQERPADVVTVDPERVLAAAQCARESLMARRLAS